MRGVPEDPVAYAKAAYGPFLDDELREEVEAMGVGDAAYFWTKLYYEMQQHLSSEYVHLLDKHVRERNDACGMSLAEPSATPFSDAERAISAHGWFTGPAIRVW